MKTNIKMRVTPEQLEKICNTISKEWLYFKSANYMYIFNDGSIGVSYSKGNWNKYNLQEIDADLFIRTNGSCEENELKDFIQSQNENIDRVNDWIKQFNDVSLKLKKKNEILKKARIKRKNQREELHKLNLKLQKRISSEEHFKIITAKNNVIKELENENYLNKSKLHLANLNNLAQQKEIEKLKAVIEYLESKVK